MELLFLLVLCGLLLFIATVVISWYFAGGRDAMAVNNLKNKFDSLEPLKGKTRAEVENVVGPPQGCRESGENKISCDWQIHRYLMTLKFDGDVCEGVVIEIVRGKVVRAHEDQPKRDLWRS
jgi:hypothetical protein